MARRRIFENVSKNRNDIVAGDVLCAKIDGSKTVFDAADAADIGFTSWTPIGVVVIPPSHDVYGTGEGAAISLVSMDYNNPDSGSITSNPVLMGCRRLIKRLRFYFYGTYTDQKLSYTSYSDSDVFGLMSSDHYPYYDGSYSGTLVQNIYDNESYYFSRDDESYNNVLISPYLTGGGRNELYGLYTNDVFSFDGKEACNNYINSISDTTWKTSSSLNQRHHNIQCSWRFHTVGTSQGDWYIPSFGELGYIHSRRYRISNSLIALRNVCNTNDLLNGYNSLYNSETYVETRVFGCCSGNDWGNGHCRTINYYDGRNGLTRDSNYYNNGNVTDLVACHALLRF